MTEIIIIIIVYNIIKYCFLDLLPQSTHMKEHSLDILGKKKIFNYFSGRRLGSESWA